MESCLGAKASKGKGLLVEALSGWEFTLDLEIEGKAFSVTRRVDAPNAFFVEGEMAEW